MDVDWTEDDLREVTGLSPRAVVSALSSDAKWRRMQRTLQSNLGPGCDAAQSRQLAMIAAKLLADQRHARSKQ